MSTEGATALPSRPALVLIRHGETTWNAAGLLQGQSDHATLTERGRRQAWQLACRMSAPQARPVQALYSSDLTRSRTTAGPLSARLGLPLRIDRRLRERRFGALEGRAASQVSGEITGIEQRRVADPDACPAGGESIRDLYLRTARFLDDLLATESPTGEGDVVAVTHGGTIRVALAYLQGVPVDQMSWPRVPNGAAYRTALAHSGHPTPTTGP